MKPHRGHIQLRDMISRSKTGLQETQRNVEPNAGETIAPPPRDLLKAAYDTGCCFVPILPGSKVPHNTLAPFGYDGKRSWSHFATERASLENVQQWAEEGLNLAMLCGSASGNWYVLDFDDFAYYQLWADTVYLDSSHIAVVETARGIHVHFRAPEVMKSMNLAYETDDDGKKHVAVELRGEGSLCMMPGSVHPSGVTYKVVSGNMALLPVLSHEGLRQLLLPFIEVGKTRDEQYPIPIERNKSRPRSLTRKSIIESFNARVDIANILTRNGYEVKEDRYTRPGGTRDSGSLLPDGKAYSHSTEDLLCDGRAHDAFDVMQQLEHGGRFESALEAAKEELGLEVHPGNRNSSSDALAGGGARLPNSEDDEALIIRLGDEILRSHSFAQDKSGNLFVFKDGYYTKQKTQGVHKMALDLVKTWRKTKRWANRMGVEVEHYILLHAPILWDKPPLNTICLQNGLLNVETRELLPHSPQYLSTVKLPVQYNPTADCPAWKRFVSQTFPLDAQCVAWEVVAWLMTPDISIQKAFLIYGEGSNGKSTYLRAVTNFLGDDNVSSLSLQYLQNNRFGAVAIMGKLANVCADLPSDHLSGTATFKSITGGDSVQAEFKGKDVFTYRPFARLLFSANELPRCNDSTQGFFRRWIVLPFDRNFESGQQIRREDLDLALGSPDELSGVLNMALDALGTLRKSGFSESPSMQKAWSEFRRTTDPISVWLESGAVSEGEGLWVPHYALYDAYCEAARANGNIPGTQNAFGRQLRRLRPNLKSSQRVVNGVKGVWGYEGITALGTPTATPVPSGGEGAPAPEHHVGSAPTPEHQVDSQNSLDFSDREDLIYRPDIPGTEN